MNFCSHCGKPVVLRVPPGDNLPRYTCDACGIIHYQNPRMIVGCLPEWEGKLLLCRRSIQPRSGYWTAPAGFMENNETLEAGAAREAHEEALARVEIDEPLALVNVPHVNQVHILFRARLIDGEYGVGEESADVALFRREDIPWDEIAFPSVTFALRRYYEDQDAGRRDVHLTHVAPMRR